MKKLKLLSLFLAIAVAVSTFGWMVPPVMVEAATTVKNGIVQDRDGIRYYVNGNYQIGWQNIGGNEVYFFTATGLMCDYDRTIGGVHTEFETFSYNGLTLYRKKTAVKNGFSEEAGGIRYYVNGKYQTGWLNIEGNELYFFAATGLMCDYDRIIGGVHTEFEAFDYNGMTLYRKKVASKNGLIAEGIRYYVDGEYLTGWQTIGGNEVYFLPDSGFMCDFNCYINDVYTEFKAFEYDGKTLYRRVKNGFIEEAGGIRYYVNDVYQTGWQNIDGNELYFFQATGLMLDYDRMVGGVYTEFEPFDYNGLTLYRKKTASQNGFVEEAGGIRYYVNDVYQTGWQNIDGNEMYFFAATGLMCDYDRTIGGVYTEFEAFDYNGMTLYRVKQDNTIDISNWDGYSNLPTYENLDFGGETFVIAGYVGSADGFNSDREIYSTGTDAISVAARERNMVVENLYNCTIEFNGSDTPGSLVAAEITTGKHTIDIYTLKYAVSSSATNGNNYNLYSLGIDFKQSWWDQTYVNTNTVKNNQGVNTLYSIVGDFSLSSMEMTHALMFNQDIYRSEIENKLGYDIYQLVRDGEWTMDIFMEMIKAGASDLSGNGVYDYSEGDIVGWASTTHGTHGLHAASALSMISTKNGVMSFAMVEDSAKWNDIMTKAITVWAMPQHDNTGYADGMTALATGNALFYSDMILKLEELSDTDTAFGIVPYPKYSETQENYAHYVDNHLMTYSVPISVADIEMLRDFFTVYAAHSTALVRPAWLDAYAYDYCGSADSREMLDIILDTRTYDPGYLMFSTFEGEISQQISSAKNNIITYIDKRIETIAGAGGFIDTFVSKISDNPY